MISMVEIKYKRKLINKLLPHLQSKEAIAIYGARQTGKTTLLEYLVENHLGSNTFYFDLEMPDLLKLCQNGPESVHAYLLQKGADAKKRINLLIDEIQYLDDPAKFIKLAHDHYPQIKLIVSGSSTFEMKKKFSQSLAGRMLAFVLQPLSFEEFLVFKQKTYKLLPENTGAINRELIPLAEEYIKFGGYPAIVLEPDEQKKKLYLFQIINTYIHKDIRDIGHIRDIGAFNRLLEVLASQSGQLLNIEGISRVAGIERLTVQNYLELLEKTFVIRRITPFSRNKSSELYKSPKPYMADTGIMHLLWLKEFPKVVLGPSFETFAYLELEKAGKEVRFWRTKSGQEVDFIVGGKPDYAFEAKLNFDASGKRHVQSFERRYKCKTMVIGLYGNKNGKYVWEAAKEIEEGGGGK